MLVLVMPVIVRVCMFVNDHFVNMTMLVFVIHQQIHPDNH